MKTREWKELDQTLENNLGDKKVIAVKKDTPGMFS